MKYFIFQNMCSKLYGVRLCGKFWYLQKSGNISVELCGMVGQDLYQRKKKSQQNTVIKQGT